jgi:pilus assembly protein Flp/PilA
MDMKAVVAFVRRLAVSEDGPTAVEYAVMLALIISVCVGTIGSLGITTKQVCDTVCTLVYGT